MTDDWKTIPNFPDYLISPKGEIKRIHRRPDGRGRMGRMLKPETHKGQPRIRLFNGTGRRASGRFMVSRLVASTFLDMDLFSPLNVGHKDNNNQNNDYRNLAIGDTELHRRLSALPGIRHPKAKLTEDDVLTIHRIRQHFETSYVEIAKMFGVNWTVVRNILKGRAWKHVFIPGNERTPTGAGRIIIRSC